MKNSKIRLFVSAALVLSISIALGYSDVRKHTSSQNYFSANSLQEIRSLNFEHQMVLEDLFLDGQSPIVSELLQADALFGTNEASENKGILIGMENAKGESNVLLLQPTDEMTDEALSEVAADYMESIPEFEFIELDQDLELLGQAVFYPANWLDRISLSSENDVLASLVTNGNDEEDADEDEGRVKVAVIDSGVDIGHEVFVGEVVLPGWNTITNDDNMYDDVGHGTHIAGIVASNANDLTIIPYKIVDENGGRLSNVVEAFRKAIDDEVDLMNTSFGVLSYSQALEELVDEAHENGIVIVSAAGNNASERGFYPGSYDNTIAVASVDEDGVKMEKSNYGMWIDVAAYGSHIMSALPNDKYGYKSGTSQATAFVTARIAGLISEQNEKTSAYDLSLTQILEALIEGSVLIEDGELAGIPIVE